MQQTIYVISGLGVDKRMFSKIDWGDRPVIYLDWLPPLQRESMAAYAQRMATYILSDKPIIVGLSFGGMMAMEISKWKPASRLLLIASTPLSQFIPYWGKWIKSYQWIQILPCSFLMNSNRLTQYFFGVTALEDKALLHQILKETDEAFLKWAIYAIANWKNKTLPTSLVQIHGSKDRILPIKKSRKSKDTSGTMESKFHVIHGAGHFMTITHAKEVQKCLMDMLHESI